MGRSDGVLLFDPHKPTILLLQGSLPITFLDRQFSDPDLHFAFNLIAFDARSTGQTENSLDACRDTWRDAADLAQAMQLLGLPSFHIFAAGGQLVHLYALRLVLLWPSLVKSITLVDAGARPEESAIERTDEVVTEALKEVSACDDLETFEWMGYELAMFTFGSGITSEMVDRVVEHMLIDYSGLKAPRYYDFVMEILHEPSLDRSLLKHVQIPVLFIQSDCTTAVRPDVAIRQADLTNAQVRTETLSSPPQAHTMEPWSREINAFLRDFILSQRSLGTKERALTRGGLSAVMGMGLRRLADISGRADLLKRDPLLSNSFSLTSLPVINKRQQVIEELISLSKAKKVGGILDEDGKPFRK
ncbi:alpha/beta-hydrolase [Calocera cornea HHB12733]|uniref:Alpha/beta-hydrolase n=1 Tax=Calocera cornea HHB12733 TaxID=1353952 RepID=A0A165GC99_9BASI|nr:alpha/beta-hydrolase [Calocera cornea HHB12733]